MRSIHEVPLNFTPTVNNTIAFYKEGHCRNTISMAFFEATEKGTSWSENHK